MCEEAQLRQPDSNRGGNERCGDNETSVEGLLGENRGGVRFPWSCSYSRLMISQDYFKSAQGAEGEYEEHHIKNGATGISLAGRFT